MYKHEPGCTGKKAYHTYDRADKVRNNQKVRLRIYTCPHCGFYHLTSQIDKPRKFWNKNG